MPIAHFYIVQNTASHDQRRLLITRATEIYAEVIGAPLDRIRTYIVPVEPDDIAVHGIPVAEGSTPAPYFTAIVLADRPVAQRAELLGRFSELLTDILEVPLPEVRGQIIEVQPENWGIGGIPASTVRSVEVAGRRTTRASRNAPDGL